MSNRVSDFLLKFPCYLITKINKEERKLIKEGHRFEKSVLQPYLWGRMPSLDFGE